MAKRRPLNLGQEGVNGFVLEPHHFKESKVILPEYGRMVIDQDKHRLAINFGEPHKPDWKFFTGSNDDATINKSYAITVNEVDQNIIPGNKLEWNSGVKNQLDVIDDLWYFDNSKSRFVRSLAANPVDYLPYYNDILEINNTTIKYNDGSLEFVSDKSISWLVGVNNDFRIKHDGSNAYLQVSTGFLRYGIQTTDSYLQFSQSAGGYFIAPTQYVSGGGFDLHLHAGQAGLSEGLSGGSIYLYPGTGEINGDTYLGYDGSIPIGVVAIRGGIQSGYGFTVTGNSYFDEEVFLYTIEHALSDTGIVLVSEGGIIRYRTTSELHGSLLNDQWFTSYDYVGNVFNVFKVSKDNIIEFGGSVSIQSLYTVPDAGIVTIANMPVENSESGSEMSYAIKIDDEDVLKVAATSDGAGGITDKRIEVPAIKIDDNQIDEVVLNITVDSSDSQAPTAKAVWDLIDSSKDKTFVHDQGVPSDTWEVTHNLHKYPSVTVLDSSSREVIGAVEYLTIDTLRITFSSSFSGTATLN
jgi:hypothetical protein